MTLLENTGLVSIVMLMVLNYISQQDQMKLLDKTEILLIGPKNCTESLVSDGCTDTSSTVKNLGVILDSNLSFENHISSVTKTAFFHLRNIAKLRNMLPVSDAEKHVFMTSILDYCNALLAARPASSVNTLQLLESLPGQENMIILPQLYSLCTGYLLSSVSILLLTYKALNGLSPVYLTSLPSRSLRP